jgi:probable rRNA maturation factor
MTLIVDFSVSDSLIDEDEDVPQCPQADLISLWAQQAFLSSEDRVVSVQIVSKAEMQQLNHDWRGKDYATNVLSFPMSIDDELDLTSLENEDGYTAPLGDIALCAAVINREAAEQSKSRDAHWAHMVVHGTLHLQGYDHINNSDAEEMESLEIKILHSLGFDNPYQISKNEIHV